MADKLFPNADLAFSGNYAVVPGPSFWAALDSDKNSYVQLLGNSLLRFGLDDSALAATEYASIQVFFDAAVFPAGFSPAIANAQAIIGSGAAYGSVMASSQIVPGSATFAQATIQYGGIVPKADLDALQLEILTIGSANQDAIFNNAYVQVVERFKAPTTTVLGPTGALTDSTPTVQWTTTIDDPTVEWETGFRVRVFNVAQYGAGGFDPAASAAVYDSGPRPYTGTRAFTLPPLAPDSYRAYVQAIQTNVSALVPDGNGFTVRRQQAGGYSFTSFTVIPVYPTIVGPTIKTDAVRDLDDATKARLFESHRPVARVTLFTFDGHEVRDLTLISGSVAMDANAAVRSKLSLSCTDIDLVPTSRAGGLDAATPLHPFGSYLHVTRGIAVDRFTTVLVGLGVFRIDTVTPDADTGRVDVKGSDFAGYIVDARFGYPVSRQDWTTSPPTPYSVVTTAQQIITEAGLAYRTPNANATPVVVNYVNKLADDRTKALDELAATTDGWNWFADIDGYIVFAAGPDYVNDPVAYTLYDGQAGYKIVNSAQSLDRSNIYDTAVAHDQNGLYVGGAYDSAVDSPIHRYAANPADLFTGHGPFSPGGKPFFYASPIVTSLPTAQSAARSRLKAAALDAEAIAVTGVPLPDLRPGKIIACPRPGSTQLVRWLVQKVSMPLDEDAIMQATAVIPTSDVVPAS